MKENENINESILDEPIKKAKVKRPKYYISNSDMIKELIIFYENGIFTEKLAEYFKKIVDGISHSPNFINYSFNDEMKGDALYRMVLAVNERNFDITREDKAFSYFTMIAWRAFQNRIKIEMKNHNGIEDYKNKIFDDFRMEFNIDINTGMGDEENE